MPRKIVTAALLLSCTAPSIWAEESKLIVENGVTYREVRGIERRPVADQRMEERTETVYRTEFVTEVREENRTTWVPITEYVYEPKWQNWWNPFAQPTVSYQMRPVVRWEPRVETVKVPVTVQKVTPETRIVSKPVRTLGFAEREYVERIVVNPNGAAANAATIARQPKPLSPPAALSVPVRR